jgi:hypothetical protein
LPKRQTVTGQICDGYHSREEWVRDERDMESARVQKEEKRGKEKEKGDRRR